MLHAYQWRALEADKETNCVCMFVKEADDEAEAVEHKWQHIDDKPQLYGIPISVKEHLSVFPNYLSVMQKLCHFKKCFFKLKGHHPTVGFAKNLSKRADDDAACIQVLKEQGAIIFATTNVPQSCCAYHCQNPIYGHTSNPYDATRTPGGITCFIF